MAQIKVIALVAFAAVLSSCGYRYTWTRHVMDGHRTGVTVPTATNVTEALGVSDGKTYTAPNGRVFEGGVTPEVAKVLMDVQPAMARLKEVVAYAPKAMDRNKPESELSNWVVDCLMAATAKATGKHVDVGITNFGGIRCDIPQGDVLLDDITSMFPFKNYLCYLLLKGSDLRVLFNQFAEHVQVVGGVKLVIKDHKLVSAEVGGEPLDDEKTYGVATIDFLLDGGDGLKIARNALELDMTRIKVFDAIEPAVRELTSEGKPFEYHLDGRVVIEKGEGE